jgi:hypothetical protein
MLLIPGVIASSYPKASGAFESIASVTASGGETSLNFTSIPSTYAALQVRGIARLSAGGSTLFVSSSMYFNDSTTTNIGYHQLYGDGTTVTASGFTGTNGEIVLYRNTAGSGIAANIFGVTLLDIQDYASTSRNKTIRFFNGGDSNGGGYSFLGSAVWQSTSAVTKISIQNGNGYAAGTTFALYGIKGA